MDSIMSKLVLAIAVIVFLVLVVKILSRKVVAALIFIPLFFWLIHPRLRDELFRISLPIISVLLLLLAMLLGLRMIIRGRIR